MGERKPSYRNAFPLYRGIGNLYHNVLLNRNAARKTTRTSVFWGSSRSIQYRGGLTLGFHYLLPDFAIPPNSLPFCCRHAQAHGAGVGKHAQQCSRRQAVGRTHTPAANIAVGIYNSKQQQKNTDRKQSPMNVAPELSLENTGILFCC